MQRMICALLCAGVLSGCGASYMEAAKLSSGQGAQSLPPLAPNDPIDLENPTYTKTVGKLMNRHCTSCHQPGGIAPFALTQYEAVKAMAQSIRTSVNNRTMPPPGVNNSGSCQNFTNAGWLSEAEIQALNSWYEVGAPKGEGNPNWSSLKAGVLPGPKVTLKIPAPYTPAPPAGSIDDYRCFVVDPAQTEDTKITAIQVMPDKVQQVHHVIVFKPTTVEAQAKAEEMSGKDGKPGFPCFGAAGVPSTIVGLWAPGGESGEMKDSESGQLLGLPLEAGRKLVIQIHYNSASGSVPDQSSIVIKFNKSALPVKWMVAANFLLSLKPGLADVASEDTQGNSWWQTIDEIYTRGLADGYISGGGLLSLLNGELLKLVLNQPDARDFKVYGVAPHMHTLGKSIMLSRVPATGTEQCLADVPQFDFRWQAGYNFVKPLQLNKTDKIKVACRFDTSGRTEKVIFGEGTSDEMCLAFLLVAQ